MDLNLLRRMAGIDTPSPATVSIGNEQANNFRRLAGLTALPTAVEEKAEEDAPAEETAEEEKEEELPSIVTKIATKAEGMKGEELVELIKKVYDAGFADGQLDTESESELTKEEVDEILESASFEEIVHAAKSAYNLTEEQLDELVRAMPKIRGNDGATVSNFLLRTAGIGRGSTPTAYDREDLARDVKQNRKFNRADLQPGHPGRRGSKSANPPENGEHETFDPKTRKFTYASSNGGAKSYSMLTKVLARNAGEGKGLERVGVPAGPRKSDGYKDVIRPISK